MTEWRLYDPDRPPDFFDNAWYHSRERAPHLEQAAHRERLTVAARLTGQAVTDGAGTVVDLGCGDGGLLSLIGPVVDSWGYDLMPANITAAVGVRRVHAWLKDFVNEPVRWADCAVITEVLEHLPDPHQMVARIADHSRWLVASSPVDETGVSHDPVHAWAWDEDGYRALFDRAGVTIEDHVVTAGSPRFQVVYGRTR